MRKTFVFVIFAMFFLIAGEVRAAANLKELDRAELEAMLPQIRSFECLKISDENRLYSKGMELMGAGDAEDLSSAADCLLMAAIKEHAKAQFELALMYYSGIGVPKSMAYAYKWATKSRLNDNRDADSFISKLDKEIDIVELRYALDKIKDTFKAYDELEMYQEAVAGKMEYDKIVAHSKDFSPYWNKYLADTLNQIDAIYDGDDPILVSNDPRAANRDSAREYYMRELGSKMGKRYGNIVSPYEKRKKLEEVKERERINQDVGSDEKKKRSSNRRKGVYKFK